MVDITIARVFSHDTVAEFAKFSKVCLHCRVSTCLRSSSWREAAMGRGGRYVCDTWKFFSLQAGSSCIRLLQFLLYILFSSLARKYPIYTFMYTAHLVLLPSLATLLSRTTFDYSSFQLHITHDPTSSLHSPPLFVYVHHVHIHTQTCTNDSNAPPLVPYSVNFSNGLFCERACIPFVPFETSETNTTPSVVDLILSARSNL